MGIGGVPIKLDPLRILESIKIKKGVVTQIQADLGICSATFYNRIASVPEYKAALDEARKDFDDHICDLAETALTRSLRQELDLGAANAAAKFVLTNKGRGRGYTPPSASAPLTEEEKQAQAKSLLDGLRKLIDDKRSNNA